MYKHVLKDVKYYFKDLNQYLQDNLDKELNFKTY